MLLLKLVKNKKNKKKIKHHFSILVIYSNDIKSKSPVSEEQGLKDQWKETDNCEDMSNRNGIVSDCENSLRMCTFQQLENNQKQKGPDVLQC